MHNKLRAVKVKLTTLLICIAALSMGAFVPSASAVSEPEKLSHCQGPGHENNERRCNGRHNKGHHRHHHNRGHNRHHHRHHHGGDRHRDIKATDN